MIDLCKAHDSVAQSIRRVLCRATDPTDNPDDTMPQSLQDRQRRRRTARASLIAWAGFACAASVASVAHSQVVLCYPGGFCYGGPFYDPTSGQVFDTLWSEDGGASWFDRLAVDPTPRVTPPPPPAHHFNSVFGAPRDTGIAGADLGSNATYWNDLSNAEVAGEDPEEFQLQWDLAQPGVSGSFDDGWNADNTPTASSDWPSDNTSFDSGFNVPDSITLNTNYNSGDGNAPTTASVGEPINSATGNVFQTQRDYMALGPFPLRFVRFYNSLNRIPAFATTELGTGWRGSYDSSIVMVNGQDVPAAVIVRPNGQSLLFTNSGGGNQWMSASPTVRATLVSQTDNSGNILGWTYTTAEDLTESYSSSGQLLSIANRAGLTQTLAYNANGQLASVTDPFGHQLLFTYNAQGQLMQMTDPAAGVYQYAYDGNNNLIAVTYPDSTTRQYLYENGAFPNAMTGLVDENGSRFVTWTYDGQGRATSSVLAGGVQPVSITYNDDGSSSVTDARGTTRQHNFMPDGAGAIRPIGNTVVGCTLSCPTISSSLSYDFTGLTATGVDPNGNTTQLTFNTRGLLTSRTEAVGTPLARTVNMAWHPVFHLPTKIAFPDGVINYSYDSQGDRTSKTVTAGGVTRTWTYAYNTQGLLTQLVGPRTDVSQVWNFSYDTQGHLTSIKDPLNHLTQFTAYDVSGHPLTAIDPNGIKASFTYDARGRVLTRTAAGRTRRYQRDAAGQVVGITFANGQSVTLTRDAAHRLTDVTDNLGIHQHRVLSVAGDVLQMQLLDVHNTLVRQQSSAHDGLGRVVATTDANQQTTTVSYDSNGNPLGSSDPLGRTATMAYDALNRPVVMTDPLGQMTAVQFNQYDRPTQITSSNGAVTRYSYDSFRQLVQEVSPDRGTTTTTYSPTGLPVSRLDARGITASATYDALNRVTKWSFTSLNNPDTPPAWLQLLGSSILSDDVSFTYDQGTGCTYGIGRLCARQDQSGTEHYAYDSFGNVTQQTDTLLGFSYSTQYAYDTGNQLTQMTYPDGRVVNYTFDVKERIATVQSTVNGVTSPVLSSLQYRADNAASSITYGNGIAETRGYDPAGRLISQLIGSADSRTYDFDAVGNMTAKQTSTESDYFSYDPLNRLNGEQRTQGTSASTNVFSYDPNGNRLSENRNGTTTALNYQANSNRLIQFGASAVTLDAAGNTTSDANGTRQFNYSAAGHLQWVGQHGIPIAGYLYNNLGQRTGKLTLQGITLYHYDIFGRLISETSVGGQPSRDYVWSGAVPVAQVNHWVPLGDMLQLAHCSVGSDGKIDWVTYLHSDMLGTPRIGTDVAQNVVWRWDGEAFGETAPNQAVPNGTYPVYVNLRNPGQYFDQETGLFLNGARYYNPQIGRYSSSDPLGLGGGLNTYSYVGSTPLNYIDPTGRCPWCAVIGAVIGGAAGGITVYLEGGSGWDIAVATGIGAASGAVAGFTLGFGSTVAGGAAAGAVGNIAGQLYQTQTVDPLEVANSGLAGAGGAAFGAAMGVAGASEAAAAAWGGVFGAAMQGGVDWTTYTNEHYISPPGSESACP